ncbi:uncharacterized protein LOC142220181 [Haematobia irritans]|uniref:uncharacterized protein LOC142220181 n=1 Tax=Haematobia irritans TaxID=7368 RepID=UPI003F4FDD35
MGESTSWKAPEWLTHEYLEIVLKKYLQDQSIHIANIDLKPATANGENYASIMTRIKITFTTSQEDQPQTLSFIMKSALENDAFADKIVGPCTQTEMEMYEKVLPQMANVLKEAADDMDQLCAKTLKVDYERSTIIFEDLKVRNYRLADRLKGLDRDHGYMVLSKLAKFHAAAAVLNERLNGALEQLNRGMFSRHAQGLAIMHENFFEVCVDYVKNAPNLGSYYHEKLVKLIPHVAKYATKAYFDNPQNDFFTLCHGDLWTTNIMMKYDKSQQLEDLLFVDFQFSNWTSPAVDLHYFFTTAMESKFLLDVSAQEEMVQFYHTLLSEMLNKLKYKGHIPTLHELWIQMEKRKFLALANTITHRAVAFASQCDDAEFRCLFDVSERAKRFRQNCYKSQHFQNVLQHKLQYFDRYGLLDIQDK